MVFQEYGTGNTDVIVLLHGGGLSWWNYREAAEQLQSDYHVILPVLDGHGDSDRDFVSIEENARELIDFLDRKFGGAVLLIGGVSLGAQILLEMLSQRRDICRYAVAESALVLPSKLTHAMIKPAFGSCYGLIRQRWFAGLQAKYLKIPENLFEDYYRDTCKITKQNMIAFLQANSLYFLKDTVADTSAQVSVFVGEKELRAMIRSAKAIQAMLPGSFLHILSGLHHGEFSLSGKAYANTIRKILKP